MRRQADKFQVATVVVKADMTSRGLRMQNMHLNSLRDNALTVAALSMWMCIQSMPRSVKKVFMSKRKAFDSKKSRILGLAEHNGQDAVKIAKDSLRKDKQANARRGGGHAGGSKSNGSRKVKLSARL